MKVLRIGTPTLPSTADSNLGNTYADSQLYFNTNNALLKPGMREYSNGDSDIDFKIMISDYSEVLPNLCKEWEIPPDLKSIIFKLNEGLPSHSGNELTTKDIEYSLERYFSQRATGYYFLTSFAGLQHIENVRIINKYSFEFITPKPTGNLLKLMSTPWITFFDSKTAAAYSSKIDPWACRMISETSCSWGPYKLHDWLSDEKMELIKCHDPLDTAPRADKIILRKIAESRKRVRMIENGEIDIAEHLMPKDLEYLKNNSDIRIMSTESTGTYQILINCNITPLNNPLIRQALNHLCPQDRIIQKAFYNNALPMDSPCSPFQPGYTGKYWEYDYNPDKAAELLKKSGYSKGFRLNLMLQDYSPQEEISCIELRETLKALNIEIELNKYSQTEYNKKLYTKDYMLASRFSFTAVRDPSYWGLWFKSGTFLNYTGISDAVLDGLLMEQENILNAEKRTAFTAGIQERIIHLAPMIFIAYPKTINAISKNIGGEYHFNPDCLAYDWSKFEL